MTIDQDLIEQLEPLHADAFSWAVACCGGDAETAADALQEAYVKVVRGRAAFGGKSALKTWWFGVVRFTVLEQQRRMQRRNRMAHNFLDWIASIAALETETEESVTAPDAEWLASALKQLPARQAEILQLVFQQELSLSEAAE